MGEEKRTITFQQWRELMDEFRALGEPSPLRLGQLFCNKFDINNPDLFYETDTGKALFTIWSEYVQN